MTNRKPSPAKRRTLAIARKFPAWYLTNGMTSPATHITAGYRAIADLSTIRAYTMRGKLTTNSRRLAVINALKSARLNLAIGRRSSPLP